MCTWIGKKSYRNGIANEGASTPIKKINDVNINELDMILKMKET